MAERSSYEPGTPSWIDLGTTDVAGAQSFYGSLFGWTFDDQGEEAGHYVMCLKDGKPVAGMMQADPDSGMPVAWSSYVTVRDADATAAAVRDAGGQVLQEPFDVMTAGRMSVLMDPTGAVICTWQPNEHIGAHLVNEHGALTWNELITPDPDAAAAFYGKVFGWAAEPFGGDYTGFKLAGRDDAIAGMMRPPMEGMPPYWNVYFAVDDCDATAGAAESAGASVLMPPTDMEGVGRLAALMDPQGAGFSVITNASPS